MKKLVAVAAAMLAGVAVFATEITFTNKVFSDDAFIRHDDDADDTDTDFPGLNERMQVELTSERVDAFVKATIKLDDHNDKDYGVTGKVNDWYIEFRPISMLALTMHEGIFTAGSYLPVWDDNMANGNISSDGFSLIVTPDALDGALRIGVTAPFGWDGGNINWLDGDKDHNGIDEEFDVGVGVIFAHELFEVGATIKDVLDSDDGERSFGAYVSFPNLFGVVEGLTVGGGVSFGSDGADLGSGDYISIGGPCGIEAGVTGDTLLNFQVSYETEPFALAAELVYNLGEDGNAAAEWNGDGVYDFYTGASISFGLLDNLSLAFTGKLLVDTSDKKDEGNVEIKNLLYGGVALTFELDEKNSFGVGLDSAFYDKDWCFAVPVYWQYKFND